MVSNYYAVPEFCSNCNLERAVKDGLCLACLYKKEEVVMKTPQTTLKEVLIQAVEAGKLAGFNANQLVYKGGNEGFSEQQEGYYDTKDAVADALKQIEAIADEQERLGRIDELSHVQLLEKDGDEVLWNDSVHEINAISIEERIEQLQKGKK